VYGLPESTDVFEYLTNLCRNKRYKPILKAKLNVLARKQKELSEIEQSRAELLAPLEAQKQVFGLFTKLEQHTLERLVGTLALKKYLADGKDSFTI